MTNERARLFISTLFDTYKLMGSDKLLNAAQQTTTQILEDATKVRELLRIDDEQLSAPTATVTRYATLRNEGAMEWDSDLLDLQCTYIYMVNYIQFYFLSKLAGFNGNISKCEFEYLCTKNRYDYFSFSFVYEIFGIFQSLEIYTKK